ncbi:putative non-specific serine/threonine protein kinase [Helianthus annuus]|nr:putative non-specific serine/threonine protein kinase [Helianthus annuus]
MLTGKFPHCLKNWQRLRVLSLRSNRLSGVIPSSIGQFPSLTWLELRFWGNAFHGKITNWIEEKLNSLKIFIIQKNHFTGGIPNSLCNNTNLRILDIAHNSITGTTPQCLGKLYGMANSINVSGLDISHIFDEGVVQVLKGVALEYTKTSSFLINMGLSSNKLVEEILVQLTRLHELVGLNLSNNYLSGRIPVQIGAMGALNSLFLGLSINKLSGWIPSSLANLTFLSHLNLSNNKLSG